MDAAMAFRSIRLKFPRAAISSITPPAKILNIRINHFASAPPPGAFPGK